MSARHENVVYRGGPKKENGRTTGLPLRRTKTSSVRVVALYLAWEANDSGIADPTVEEIMDATDLIEKTVRRALVILEDDGWIVDIDQRPRDQRGGYATRWLLLWGPTAPPPRAEP